MKGARNCGSGASRLTVWINEREALPVRAIPYVADWKKAPPLWIAEYLAKGAGVPRGAIPLSAYQLINDAPVTVMPREWDLPVAKVKGLVHALQEQRPGLDPMDDHAGYATYQARAIDELPHSVFVWLDEFESAYQTHCERNHLGSDTLALAPMATNDETTRARVLKGFEWAATVPASAQIAGTTARDDGFTSLCKLLDGYWEKPWSDLSTKQQRAWYATTLAAHLCSKPVDVAEGNAVPDDGSWDMNTVEVRQRRAEEYDAQHDPMLRLIGWYDVSLNAKYWFGLSNVKPNEAAMLLWRLNPQEKDRQGDAIDPERIYVDGDESTPDKYRMLLRAFEDKESTSPKHRPLMDWLAIAREKGLRYHSWIDEYLKARATLEPSDESEVAKLQISSAKPWEVVDQRDPAAAQPWYTAARYFARELIKGDASLIGKRGSPSAPGPLAINVAKDLAERNIYGRGKKLSSATVLKAFTNVVF